MSILKNKTHLFLALTFFISYSLAGIFKLLGGAYQGISVVVLGVLYMFIPALCVVVVEKIIYKQAIKNNFFISFKINNWFVVAWLFFPLMSLLTLAISLLFPDVTYSPEMDGILKRFEETLTPEQLNEIQKSSKSLPFHPVWLVLIQGLIAGTTINAFAAFGEELGWRGFLLKQFKHLSFFKASLIIGFIWGIWHAPLILMGHNYPQHPVAGVFMMTLWCILLSPLFTYITIKSRSVIAASIFHGTLNATAGIAILFISGGNDLTTGVTGFPGMIALSACLCLLFIYDSFISREKIMIQPIESTLL